MKKSINLEMDYDHSIEKVWNALTNKDALSKWLMPNNMEPVLGNKFQFTTKAYPGFDGTVECEVLKVEAPNVLVYSWSGGGLKDTIVKFELTSNGNKTHMKFTHSGFEGFMNNLIAKRILARGWRRKILKIQLTQYLANV
jgi:uncharacterized protein YndB with AHSA1/START domain